MREEFLKQLGVFETILATSVYEDEGSDELLRVLAGYAEESPHYFPEDAYTDMPEKALVAEVVREKLLLNLRDRAPAWVRRCGGALQGASGTGSD